MEGGPKTPELSTGPLVALFFQYKNYQNGPRPLQVLENVSFAFLCSHMTAQLSTGSSMTISKMSNT